MITLPEKSLLFAREPKWRDCRPGNYKHTPYTARSWLFEGGSITQRLRGIYGEQIAVKVLRQHWDRPFPSESRLLRIAYRRRCLVREVLIHASGKPLVLARTIIPSATLRGAQRSLQRLGSRPLGEVIFSSPKLQRMEMQITEVKPGDWLKQLSAQIPLTEPLWGRRTVYAIRNRQLLVGEFFLPGLVDTGS